LDVFVCPVPAADLFTSTILQPEGLLMKMEPPQTHGPQHNRSEESLDFRSNAFAMPPKSPALQCI